MAATIKPNKLKSALKSVTTAQPIHDCAPRLEKYGASSYYEFHSLSDLVECLDKGTFQLEISAEETATGIKSQLLGRYSTWELGRIKFALMGSALAEKIANNQSIPSLHYSLLKKEDPNYETLVEKSDTHETMQRWMEHVKPHLEAVREKYYPDFSDNVHIPFELKFKKPKPTTTKTKVHDKEGSKEVESVNEDSFDVQKLIAKKGRLLASVKCPWFMDSGAGLNNKLMGLAYMLEKKKYLNAEEKEELARETGSNKRQRTEISKE